MASWDILGNNGTNPNDPNGNFLGTIDNEPLAVRTNNTERLRVDTNGNVGIGTTSPTATLTVNGNSIVGKAASSADTTFAAIMTKVLDGWDSKSGERPKRGIWAWGTMLPKLSRRLGT